MFLKFFTKSRLVCLIVVFFFTSSLSFGQRNPQRSSFLVGDKLPDLEFRNLINWMSPSVKLSRFKGKLVILDFWATWCAPCVGMMPKLESLQHKYRDRFQVISITAEDAAKALSTFKIKGLQMMSVTRDTLLRQYFPHNGIPHYVWISSKGNVIAITGAEQINEKNIKFAIENDNISLPIKNDFLAQNQSSEISVTPNLTSENVFYKSEFSKWQGEKAIWEPGVNSIRLIRCPVFALCRFAYSKKSLTPSPMLTLNRIILDIEDKEKCITGGEDQSMIYNYHLIIPLDKRQDREQSDLKLLSILRNDIENAFGIKGEYRYQPTKCFVVTCPDSTKLIQNGTEANDNHVLRVNAFKSPISQLFFQLNDYYMSNYIPVIDETRLKGNYSIAIETDWSDLEKIKKAFEAVGLRLVEAERNLEMLLLKKVI